MTISASESGLLDDRGHLNQESLADGMFTLRFTSDRTKLVLTWIPDDPNGEILRKEFDTEDPEGAGVGGPEYLACLAENAGEGLKAVLKCTPELFK